MILARALLGSPKMGKPDSVCGLRLRLRLLLLLFLEYLVWGKLSATERQLLGY